MRKVCARNKIIAKDGFRARHNRGFGKRFNASHRKFSKFFPGTDRDRQTSPRAGLRRGFDRDKKKVAAR
jgi:hypothetical protein